MIIIYHAKGAKPNKQFPKVFIKVPFFVHRSSMTMFYSTECLHDIQEKISLRHCILSICISNMHIFSHKKVLFTVTKSIAIAVQRNRYAKSNVFEKAHFWDERKKIKYTYILNHMDGNISDFHLIDEPIQRGLD